MTNDEREAFAREVVALARKYKVRSVAMQYRDGFSEGMFGEFSIAWAEGRHGDLSNISLAYRDTKGISEKEPSQ